MRQTYLQMQKSVRTPILTIFCRNPFTAFQTVPVLLSSSACTKAPINIDLTAILKSHTTFSAPWLRRYTVIVLNQPNQHSYRLLGEPGPHPKLSRIMSIDICAKDEKSSESVWRETGNDIQYKNNQEAILNGPGNSNCKPA